MTGRRRRRSTQAPTTRPNSKRGEQVDRAHERDLEGARIQDEDRHERQGHPRDERAEDRDRGRRPDAHEGVVLPQCGRERVAHGPGSIHGPWSRRDLRPAAPPRTLRYTAPASVRQNPRTTGTAAAPRRDRPGPHQPTGVLIGPCSTPSASAFERRSAT